MLTIDLAGLFWASAKPKRQMGANMKGLIAVFLACEIWGLQGGSGKV